MTAMIEDMNIEELRNHPELPESEFEWEDLLLRLEVMSRALRVEMENAVPEKAQPILLELADREAVAQRLLEEVAGVGQDPQEGSGTGGSQGGRAAHAEAGVPPLSAVDETGYTSSVEASGSALVDRFVRLRSRNFAMLQRRGIEVWKWRIPSGLAAGVTVFQLLSLVVRGDVEILGRLRQVRTSQVEPC